MRVCAGIVLYNPEIKRLQENIKAIIDQVEHIYIVDNGSTNFREIEGITRNYLKITLLTNGENLGIAKGLNQMCQSALENGYEWILTLDQDSICPEHMIDQFIRHADKKKVGIICPAIFYDGWENSDKELLKPVEDISACMTSASLTNVEAWKEVEGFCEEYFIDYVDNEFCMKLKNHNYKILRINTCVLKHQLGESGCIRMGRMFTINYSRHTPIRLYYMTRNNLMFIKQYSSNLNVFKEYLKMAFVLFTSFFVSNQKLVTLKYIMLGIKDYRKNKMGKCDFIFSK